MQKGENESERVGVFRAPASLPSSLFLAAARRTLSFKHQLCVRRGAKRMSSVAVGLCECDAGGGGASRDGRVHFGGAVQATVHALPSDAREQWVARPQVDRRGNQRRAHGRD